MLVTHGSQAVLDAPLLKHQGRKPLKQGALLGAQRLTGVTEQLTVLPEDRGLVAQERRLGVELRELRIERIWMHDHT